MKQSWILPGLIVALVAGAGGAQRASVNPLDGKTFLSLEKLQSGEKRDGTIVLGHWEIRFKGKSYSWRHSDVISTGTYHLDTKTSVLSVKAGSRKIEASFDAKTGTLTWDKRKYKAVKSKK